LETQLLNNQIYNQQAKLAQQQQQSQSFSAQNQAQAQTYSGAKEVAISNTNAGYVASKFDVMHHPFILVQNALLGLGAAIGITRFADYLVKPDFSKIDPKLSHSQALEHSPLFKFGKKMDALVAKIPGFNTMLEKAGALKNKITGAASKSEILSEVGKKYQDGSKVRWSMGKFYEEGKGAEAMDEFVEFLEKAPEGAFTKPETKEAIAKILKDVKEEKLSRSQAGVKIVQEGHLDGISAKYLDEVLHIEAKGFGATIDKVFGTAPNLNTALSKAKFFNNKTKGLGPISKAFNSLSLMMMEGVGGGVLGGKMAMIMSVMGLVSAFNACSKANVAKHEKEKQLENPNLTPEQRKEIKKGPWTGEQISAFMEDFAGFTLGGYLMTFPIGVGLNKLLGLANLGRDGKKIQEAADKLGVQGDKHLFQRSTIKYNETLKQHDIAKNYIDILDGKKKHSLFDRFKKAIGLSSDASIHAKMMDKLKIELPENASKADVMKALNSKIKADDWLDETRKQLVEASKSKLTIKESEFNKGSFFKRLGKFAVHKPLEIAAKLLGPDKFLIYSRKGTITNKLRTLTGVGGGVGRIILVGMVLTVPFRNAFMKVAHGIFGKPSFSQYDEVKGVYEEKEKEAQTKEAAQGASKAKIQLPGAEQATILPPPAYQQQVSEANPYEGTIKAAVEDKIQDKVQDVPTSPVRKLDTYTYIPKA